MTKILLAGDAHGDPYQIEYLFGVALQYQCDKIFQLGDYGFWAHRPGGEEYLEVTSELATFNYIPFYWLDGNHENHVLLRADYSDKIVEDGMWELRPGLFYSPRGNRFSWDGVDFMTMGGAYSIDRAHRRVGESFWFEEEITDEEIDSAIGRGTPINVLLSHDIPEGVDMQKMMSKRGVNYRAIPGATAGRQRLRRLVDGVRPSHIFHGHYHIRYTDRLDLGYGPVTITGLNCEDSEQESWVIIDTKDWHHANGI